MADNFKVSLEVSNKEPALNHAPYLNSTKPLREKGSARETSQSRYCAVHHVFDVMPNLTVKH